MTNTGAMRIAPAAATEVLLGLPPLRAMTEATDQAGIYILMCSQLWKPKSKYFGHARKSQDMEHEPILQMGTDRMIQRYAYHKQFMVQFPDKGEWQNKFKPDINTLWTVWPFN
jgi:hypothetical protein